MLYVKIELWPKGDRKRATTLHEGVIYNDATGTEQRGNYVGRFSKRGGFKHADGREGAFRDGGRHEIERVGSHTANHSILRQGELSGFPRKRFGGWHLLLMTLLIAFKDDFDEKAKR